MTQPEYRLPTLSGVGTVASWQPPQRTSFRVQFARNNDHTKQKGYVVVVTSVSAYRNRVFERSAYAVSASSSECIAEEVCASHAFKRSSDFSKSCVRVKAATSKRSSSHVKDAKGATNETSATKLATAHVRSRFLHVHSAAQKTASALFLDCALDVTSVNEKDARNMESARGAEETCISLRSTYAAAATTHFVVNAQGLKEMQGCRSFGVSTRSEEKRRWTRQQELLTSSNGTSYSNCSSIDASTARSISLNCLAGTKLQQTIYGLSGHQNPTMRASSPVAGHATLRRGTKQSRSSWSVRKGLRQGRQVDAVSDGGLSAN